VDFREHRCAELPCETLVAIGGEAQALDIDELDRVA
jgi:hypothetical protein